MAETVRIFLNLMPQRSMEAGEQEPAQAGASCTTSQVMGSDKGSRPPLSITPQKAYFGILHLNQDMQLKANPERLKSTKEPVMTFPSSETRATIISHRGKKRLYLRNSIVQPSGDSFMRVVEGHWNGTAFRIMCRQISIQVAGNETGRASSDRTENPAPLFLNAYTLLLSASPKFLL